ncbi:hypothetical protein ACFQVD_28085 [Streptosporangium amethystogenes subsp. fukuiense]|uniref:Uncharacterized protein n=1 Tax=Streptosporangium amethystogenes subsp. fukuiense TaxID=698418 RepID=A0ABW2T5Z6_9ACTN
MRPSRGFAVLAVAAVAATGMIATPAAATPDNPARYAWLKSCPRGDGSVPCGSWMLTLRSGRTVKLPGAQVHPRSADGKVDRTTSNSISVSNDGRFVNYFKGGELVVREVSSGKVRPLPGGTASLPKGIGQSDVDTTLSPDGSAIVVDYYDTANRLPTLVVNLKTGETAKLPPKNSLMGFSPSGKYLLTSRFTEDNITEFTVFDAEGNRTASQVIPQIVSNNAPVALADDGNTVALVISSESSRPRLRTYDLSADTVSEAIGIGMPKDETAQRLSWDAAGSLTLWTSRSDQEGELDSAVKRTLNAETGSTRKLDSFRLRKNVWVWWLPGE